MKADRKRLDQCQMTRFQRIVEDQLFGRQHDLVGQAAILLHAKRLVITARIEPALAAGRTFTAICVRQHDHPLAAGVGGADALACFNDLAADLVPRNTRQLHQRIKPLESVQVAAAEPHMPNPHADMPRQQRRFVDFCKTGNVFALDAQSFDHRIIPVSHH